MASKKNQRMLGDFQTKKKMVVHKYVPPELPSLLPL